MITVHLNGEPREIPEGLTLAALLEWLRLAADRVAVERNLEIVPRNRWFETLVEAGDRLEVVHFVGGGSHSGFEICPLDAPRPLTLRFGFHRANLAVRSETL